MPQPVPAGDPDEILLVAAVLAGLRAAMVRTLEPMPVEDEPERESPQQDDDHETPERES